VPACADLGSSLALTRDEVSSRIRALLQSEFGLDLDQTLPQARLQEDLDLDSIDLVAIAMRLEQEMVLLAKKNPLHDLQTVQDLVGYVFALQLPAQAIGRPG
jgi:acyl carrier protein